MASSPLSSPSHPRGTTPAAKPLPSCTDYIAPCTCVRLSVRFSPILTTTFFSLTATPHVHLCNLAAQTGASLYLHLNSSPYPHLNLLFKRPIIEGSAAWIYNKTENLDDYAIASSRQITHIITERQPSAIILESFIPVANITAFDRWPLDKDTLQEWGLGIIRNPSEALRMTKLMKASGSTKLWILERKETSFFGESCSSLRQVMMVGGLSMEILLGTAVAIHGPCTH